MWDVVVDIDQEADSLLLGLLTVDRPQFQRQRVHICPAELEFQLAGFDLGQVEDVVDERQERRAARPYRLEVLGVDGVVDQPVQDLAEAQDRVHGRADLVRHVGQELALRAIRDIGRFARSYQLFLRAHPLRNVLLNTYQVSEFVVGSM